MKKSCFILLCVLFFAGEAKAFFSISIETGSTSTEMDRPGGSDVDTIDGKVTGAFVGFSPVDWVIFEVGLKSADYDKYTYQDDYGNSFSLDMQFLNTTYGFRLLMLWRILSLKYGLISSSYDLDISTTGVYTGYFNRIDDSGNGTGYYFGLGVNIPLSILDLYFDYEYTVVNLEEKIGDSDSTGSSGVVAGFRLNF